MNNLKTLRERFQKTQAEIADILGITRAAYTNIENGKRQIDNNNLLQLANYFNVSADYILGRDNVEPQNEKPTVDDDGLRAKAIERVQALSDPEVVRVLDFLKGLEAGREIEAAPLTGHDSTPESSE